MSLRKGQQSTSDDDDLCSDNALEIAYDKAVAYAKIEVAQRIARSTNNVQRPKLEYNEHKKSKKSKRRKVVYRQKMIGSNCRAIFSHDGEEYEAQILNFLNDDTVTVIFLGYDNEEIVMVSSLKESSGPQAIAEQLQQALEDGYSIKSRKSSAQTDSLLNGTFLAEEISKSKQGYADIFEDVERKIPPPFCVPPGNPFGLDGIGNIGFMGLGALDGLSHASSHDRNSMSDEPLTAMLVSWYLSGYYTGYYKGLNKGKRNKRGNNK